MKLVLKNEVPANLKNAAQLEKEGEIKQAAKMYEHLLKQAPNNLTIMTRLMICYRKAKAYKKEIDLIDKAIKVHDSHYQSLKLKDNAVVSLSKKINNVLGHTNRKGKNLLLVPEIDRLQKRKEVSTKRMK